MKKIKSFITVLLAIAMMITLTACGGDPIVYDAPADAPYKELYVMDKMNSSCSYEYTSGTNLFEVEMQWRTKDENVESAEFTDEFYLEWSTDENAFFELCQPVNDMSGLKNNKHTIKPGENFKTTFDVDSYFDGLPTGYYRIVVVYTVNYKDGTTEQRVAAYAFDMN